MTILEKLKGGDLRSIGNAEEAVSDILENPQLFAEVFDGMLNENPRIRMRAADAVEKVSRSHPEYLEPYKNRLINEVSQIEQQEVRWHVAQMFSYLELEETERKEIIYMLFLWIEKSKSKIVIVNSMQTLADLAEKDSALRPMIIKKLDSLIKTGSPAIVSRGRKLIKKLRPSGDK